MTLLRLAVFYVYKLKLKTASITAWNMSWHLNSLLTVETWLA